MNNDTTQRDRIQELEAAIRLTLENNQHLADGNDCTLVELKRVYPTHYQTVKNGKPICDETFGKCSLASSDVNCPSCLSIIQQRQNMGCGDWLK